MNNTKPTIAFFPAHPAQLWLMYEVAKNINTQANILWILRDKDILLSLAESLSIEYILISKSKTGFLGNAIELFSNILRAFRLTKKFDIQVWFTKYGAGNIAATLCRRISISFNDDDIDIVPLIALTSYPFAKRILAPNWVRMGRFGRKTVRFNGSNELVYLHRTRFAPKIEKLIPFGIQLDTKFIIVRLSALNAHHDRGISGVSESFLRSLILTYKKKYRILVSSEKPLSREFEEYRFLANVNSIHHFLHFASCLICDSLSMALEAAAVGTPTVRLSDFGSEISAFSSIEKYKLIFNFSPNDTHSASGKIREILETGTVEFKNRSKIMQNEMEDPLPFFAETILDCANQH